MKNKYFKIIITILTLIVAILGFCIIFRLPFNKEKAHDQNDEIKTENVSNIANEYVQLFGCVEPYIINLNNKEVSIQFGETENNKYFYINGIDIYSKILSYAPNFNVELNNNDYIHVFENFIIIKVIEPCDTNKLIIIDYEGNMLFEINTKVYQNKNDKFPVWVDNNKIYFITDGLTCDANRFNINFDGISSTNIVFDGTNINEKDIVSIKYELIYKNKMFSLTKTNKTITFKDLDLNNLDNDIFKRLK